MLSYVKGQFPELSKTSFSQTHDDVELHKDLERYEEQMIQKKYKFGILLVREGQTEEDDMMANGKRASGLSSCGLTVRTLISASLAVEMSEGFQGFLNFLGERITLKGWQHFRGGLDVKSTVVFYTMRACSVDRVVFHSFGSEHNWHPLGLHSLYGL